MTTPYKSTLTVLFDDAKDLEAFQEREKESVIDFETFVASLEPDKD